MLGTATASYLVQGFVAGLGLVLAAPLLVGLFQLSDELAGAARTALAIGAVGLAVRVSVAGYAAVPAGLQRFDVIATRRVLAGTASLVTQAALAIAGVGLVGLVATAAACEVIGDLALVGWARRKLGRNLHDQKVDLGLFPVSRTILNYTFKSNNDIFSKIIY